MYLHQPLSRNAALLWGRNRLKPPPPPPPPPVCASLHVEDMSSSHPLHPPSAVSRVSLATYTSLSYTLAASSCIDIDEQSGGQLLSPRA